MSPAQKSAGCQMTIAFVERTLFDSQPTLEGNLLLLRPLRSDDFDELFGVASDPLIWEQHPVKNRWEEDAFRNFFRDSLDSGGALVAIDVATGKMIGSSRFHAHSVERSEVEIGWTFLARSHWGGVYNGEMKRLMIQHAFHTVRHVVFLVVPENIRSRRAVEKLGAIQIGVRPDAGGRESLVFRITAVGEWS